MKLGNRIYALWFFIYIAFIGGGCCVAEAAGNEDSVTFTVKPQALGRQLVRVSIPSPSPTALASGKLAITVDGSSEIIWPAIRPLGVVFSDGQEVPGRRALVTFPYDFVSNAVQEFRLVAPDVAAARHLDDGFPFDISISGDVVALKYNNGATVNARILSPAIEEGVTSVEVVEQNQYFIWKRYHQRSSDWLRTIEVRADALGTVALVVHLLRRGGQDSWLPRLGWCVNAPTEPNLPVRTRDYSPSEGAEGISLTGGVRIYHPVAKYKGAGSMQLRNAPDGLSWTYLLGGSGSVPFQPYSWRKAEVIISKNDQPPLTWTLQYPLACRLSYDRLSSLYSLGEKGAVGELAPVAGVLALNRSALLQCMRLGSDFGNVTLYKEESMGGDALGWNRLNHCSPLFFEAWKTDDDALRDMAILWCENFHDLTVWWGPKGYGGSRYNSALGTAVSDYMWRSNSAVDFCTKGFSAFLLAYEETGDPRMLEALTAQLDFAEAKISALVETRNVGVVRDLVDLWRYAGRASSREAAMRIGKEYLSRRSLGGLVSQSGRVISPVVPFIDDDAVGERYSYPKPYIIGYGVAGMAAYSEMSPEHRMAVSATLSDASDFLVRAQDPIGGWRYPHPRSSGLGLSLSVELAWQLVNADGVLGVAAQRLDSIESVLRQRVLTMRRSGRVLDHITGWEASSRLLDKPSEIYRFYEAPQERNAAYDYTLGGLVLGRSAPEGLIYLPELLRYYARHRSLSILLQSPNAGSPLHSVFDRLPTVDD